MRDRIPSGVNGSPAIVVEKFIIMGYSWWVHSAKYSGVTFVETAEYNAQ